MIPYEVLHVDAFLCDDECNDVPTAMVASTFAIIICAQL